MLFDHKSYVGSNAISRKMFAPLTLASSRLAMSIANIIILFRVCGMSFFANNGGQIANLAKFC